MIRLFPDQASCVTQQNYEIATVPWRGFIDGQLKSLGFSHMFIFLQFHVVWFDFNLPIRGEKFFKRQKGM